MDTVVNGATFSFPVRADREQQLRVLLKGMEDGSGLFPMEQASVLHFATWVIVPEETTATLRKLPMCLLLVTTYNGSLNNHMKELASLAPEGLHQLMLCCAGYRADSPSAGELFLYLKKCRKSNFVYNAYQYTSPETIRKESILQKAIQSYLDREEGTLLNKSATEIRRKIQEFVQHEAGLEWARTRFRTGLYSYLKLNTPWILMAGFLLTVLVSAVVFIFITLPIIPALLVTLGSVVLLIAVSQIMQSTGSNRLGKRRLLLVPLTILYVILFMVVVSVVAAFSQPWIPKIIALSFLVPLSLFLALLVWLRINERKRDFPEPPSDEFVQEITRKEKFAVCNEMNVIGPLKPGLIRPLFLAVILVFAKIIRPFSYIPTVQTSRWLQLDKGWRIVFVAYFDNTSEGYANDFVDSKTFTRRVNLLFGHGAGFPSTRWAILSGGKDRRGYMDAVRRQGKITQVWYNSHPELSILNIRNNRRIRKGLWGSMNERKAQQWLHLF